MRKPIYPCILAISATLAVWVFQAIAGTIDNHSIWRDTGGNEIKAQGGCILQEGNVFHWIGAEFESADFHFRAINRYTSTDLQNWTRQQPVLTPNTPGLSSVPIHSTSWVGRPWVMKRDVNDYVMWIEAGKLSGSAYRNRFAVFHATDIAGPWTFGAVYASLPDGTGTEYPLGDLGAYHDTSTGNAYLLYTFDKGEANGYQAIVKLSPDFRKVLTPSEGGVVAEFPKSTYYGQEAAAIFKRGSAYYHIMSDTRGWRPSVTRYRTSTAIGPASTWSALQEVRMNPAGSAYSFRTQHDFVLTVTGTETTNFIFIGDRWRLYDTTDYAGAVGRQAWFKMAFDSAGQPTIDASNFAADGGDWFINPVTGAVGGIPTSLRYRASSKSKVNAQPIFSDRHYPFSAIQGRHPFHRWEWK
jgi:Glycosyl hydrolases family 43